MEVVVIFVPDPGANPESPYSIIAVPEPPPVHVTSVEVALRGVATMLLGSGHVGALEILKSSMAISLDCDALTFCFLALNLTFIIGP